MGNSINVQAYFDALSIAHGLNKFMNGFTREEVQLFSYFASFIFVFNGHVASEWPYRYTVQDGYPFADEINDAIDRHLLNGNFDSKNEYLVVSKRGLDDYDNLKQLETLNERENIIAAACTTTILLPYSQTARALLAEETLVRAVKLGDKNLLDPSDNVYQQFKNISESVGIHQNDLVLVAVTYVNFLLGMQSESRNDGSK